MAQAKTLTQAELDQVLRYVSTRKFPERNRAIILTSFWSGLRVGEIAALKIHNLVNEELFKMNPTLPDSLKKMEELQKNLEEKDREYSDYVNQVSEGSITEKIIGELKKKS